MLAIEKELTVQKTQEGVRYYKNVVYPDIPYDEDDIYVIATAGDRYDTLALDFYGDVSLWKIIAAANPPFRGGLIPILGSQIRIPANKDTVIDNLSKFNKIR